MAEKSKQQLYKVVVVFESGKTRELNVKASTKKVAHRRALKRASGAVSVQEAH
jgi:hypothetical protein